MKNKRTVTVIGCGRWGSCIAWYLANLGHDVTLYGRRSSAHMAQFMATRSNGLLTLPETVLLCTDTQRALQSDTVIVSVDSQHFRELLKSLSNYPVDGKTLVLCMKGLETGTGKRLSEIVREELGERVSTAVWLGPGHVQDFVAGLPNCMVIDSADERVKYSLVEDFSGSIIRFYYGADLIGNEIGAAAKNVIGIAGGVLDGLGLPSLKGALMTRGPREISRLIAAMGGNAFSAYGLCHLGDYQATVFSPYSHNRRFGEALVKHEPYDALAEGYYTVPALLLLAEKYGVELPISKAVYDMAYHGARAQDLIERLLVRNTKREF